MPLTIPSTFYPVFESSLLMGKEAPTTPGTAATSFTGVPTGPLQISNKFTPLEDPNLRGSNVEMYGLQFGSRWAEITIPESPCYPDSIGMALMGLMGDLTTTGTAGTPTWTTSGALTPGAGPIAVTSGSSAVSGTNIQIDTGVNAEVVTVGTGSTATSIVISAATPIRFSHLSGVTITTVTAPFTHTFSNINPNSSTGNSSAHPPTYTLLHRNLIPGSGNNYADQYLYTNMSEIKFEAKKNGWFVWSGKAMSYFRGYPTTNYTPSFTTVTALPSWKSAISLASSTIYNISDLSVTISRKIDSIVTADGVQDPYAFGAGPLGAAFTADYDAITDESQLNHLTNNDQPTLSWQISNGGSGSSLASFEITAAATGYETADLVAVSTQWGYKTGGKLIASTSDGGNSGGYSPLQVILQNAIPTYSALGDMAHEGINRRTMHLI